MSDMLSIGASGVRAYQTALNTVSDNIANSGSAGYSRRVATVREVAAPASIAGTTSGMGAVVSGITRTADDLRSADVRSASSDLGRTEAGATWLDRIQNALTGGSLGDSLTSFFNSATTLAADPTSIGARSAMLESASGVASAFARTGNGLADAANDLDASGDAAASQLTTLSASLAKVNAGLGKAQPGTAGSAALLDQRDQILEQMSAISDVTVSLDGVGRASVQAGGATLVEGQNSAIVTYARGEEGAVSFAAHFNGYTHAMAPNGGAIAGIAEGGQRIADAQHQLDAMAQSFADGVNQIQANGRDLSGNPGAAMFAAGDPPSQMTMTLTDPRGIAAAGVGGGTRDNTNLSQLQALRTGANFEGGVTDLVTTNAAALAAKKTVADAQTSIHDNAVAARDAASGVNIDEEAVDLLRFQQAYQASSRVIQVARETIQSILDIH